MIKAGDLLGLLTANEMLSQEAGLHFLGERL